MVILTFYLTKVLSKVSSKAMIVYHYSTQNGMIHNNKTLVQAVKYTTIRRNNINMDPYKYITHFCTCPA